MDIRLRPPTPDDTAVLGDICHRAFATVAEAHGFPSDVPNAEVGRLIVGSLSEHPRVFGVVAEVNGRVVGSNFLDERNPISGVGPITVDPDVQNDGAGRALMDAVLGRSAERGFPGVRLVQAGYHSRSLALYLKLGFEAREQLACLQGPAIVRPTPGHASKRPTGRSRPRSRSAAGAAPPRRRRRSPAPAAPARPGQLRSRRRDCR